MIENYIRRHKLHGDKKSYLLTEKEAVTASSFKISNEWKILKSQFSKKELNFFFKRYNEITSQFKEVTATEKIQIIDVISFIILKNRVLAVMKQNKFDIVRLNKQIKDFYIKHQGEDLTDAQLEYIAKLEEILAGAKASQSAKVAEIQKLSLEERALLKDLKATRDQRLEKVEAASKDFMGLIKALEEREFREQEGRQLELVKKATENEAQKLRDEIQYSDGEFDSPILDSKTVLNSEKE